MSHSTEMILQLQSFQRKSKIYETIFNAEGKQFDNRDAIIEDLKLQLSVDTATYALAIYETELGIVTDTSKTLAERRSVIKSKIRGTGQVDAALIKLVADSFTNGDVDVSFDGSITVTFTSIIGIPTNIEDLENAIEEIRPAHLAVIYVLLFNTHQKLSQYTHGFLGSFTYNDLRNTDLS